MMRFLSNLLGTTPTARKTTPRLGSAPRVLTPNLSKDAISWLPAFSP